MDAETRHPHRTMLLAAGRFCQLLTPFAAKLEIAGSLRRGKPQVKDIEIVLQPKGCQEQLGSQVHQELVAFMDGLHREGYIRPRLNKKGNPIAWKGDREKAFEVNDPVLHQWLPVDLFITTGHRWGLTYLIRTGPGEEANRALVSTQGAGGVCPDDILFWNSNLYRLKEPQRFRGDEAWKREAEKTLLPTRNEVEVFQWLGIPAIAPHARTAEEYQRLSIVKLSSQHRTERVHYKTLYDTRWYAWEQTIYSPDTLYKPSTATGLHWDGENYVYNGVVHHVNDTGVKYLLSLSPAHGWSNCGASNVIYQPGHHAGYHPLTTSQVIRLGMEEWK